LGKKKGEKNLDTPLSKIGDKGLFTRELEQLLLNGEADIAVHSLKDMPTTLPEGLEIGGVLKRGEVRDALVSLNGKKLSDLDGSDIVATSSLRRVAQLKAANDRIRVIEIRGNVDTRMKKMSEGYCTAMVMAGAGLQRLGYGESITELLDPYEFFPAVSQGAIAIELRSGDDVTGSLVSAVNDHETMLTVTAERNFLHELEGGCQIPAGCYSELLGDRFRITGFISGLDGKKRITATGESSSADAAATGISIARRLIASGADKIINELRSM
jgi:hydroxymethylbilane synthase